MTDERHDFAQARVRLEEIVAQVRKKDTSLERSLDLLEEGVRLANVCTELSDHTEWRTVIEERDEGVGAEFAVVADEPADGDEAEAVSGEEPSGAGDEVSSAE